MTLNSIYALAEWFGTTPEHLEKAVYDGTDCGAWIQWTDTTVAIGSIVDGSDAEFDESFAFPADTSEIEEWLQELEELCEEAWYEANGEEGVQC